MVRLFKLTAAVFVDQTFGWFYLEFNFWPTLRYILQRSHTIVWNKRGYPYVKLHLTWWNFTHGIAKSLGGSLFSGHSVYSTFTSGHMTQSAHLSRSEVSLWGCRLVHVVVFILQHCFITGTKHQVGGSALGCLLAVSNCNDRQTETE